MLSFLESMREFAKLVYKINLESKKLDSKMLVESFRN